VTNLSFSQISINNCCSRKRINKHTNR